MKGDDLTDVKSILDFLNVKIQVEEKNHYRIKAFWRGGSNPTSARVHKKSGHVTDFVSGERFSIKELAKKIGREDFDFKKFFEQHKIRQIDEGEKLNIVKTYDKDCLIRLLPNYTYWNNRGISDETLKEYQGGIANSGKLYQRYVFPVYNRERQIVGFAGRCVTGRYKDNKWKIIGGKYNFLYPCHLAEPHIKKEGIVVLVESIGDSLSLWESGVKNNLSIFGLNLSSELLSYLLSFSDLKVIIALNNDESKRGNNAAVKIKKKIDKFIDPHNVIIALPPKGDFNEVLEKGGVDEVAEWYSNALRKLTK